MRHYLYLDNGHLWDEAAQCVIISSKKTLPYELKVPFFSRAGQDQGGNFEKVHSTGFQMVDGKLVDQKSVVRSVNMMSFPQWRVIGGVDYIGAVVEFYDRINQCWHAIDVSGKPMMSPRGGIRDAVIRGFDYTLRFDGVSKQFITSISRDTIKQMGFLGHYQFEQRSKQVMPVQFSYGLAYKQYACKYKGRFLDGKSYEFMFGMWAILLDDDLSFDAFVLLDSCSPGQISIQQFIYIRRTPTF